MASGRQKTTMNKINRERKLREKRLAKKERKIARANGEIDLSRVYEGDDPYATSVGYAPKTEAGESVEDDGDSADSPTASEQSEELVESAPVSSQQPAA
jgi:hypothetical protein